MIQWIEFNPASAPEEIEEDTVLIYSGDRVVSATHDAVNRLFYYEGEGYEVIYHYRLVSHYAKFNIPTSLNERNKSGGDEG